MLKISSWSLYFWLYPWIQFFCYIVSHKMFKHSFNSCRGRSSLKGGQIIYKIIYVSYLLLCAWFKNSNYFSEFCRLARWIVILLISPRLTILYLAGWSAGNSTQLTWLDISFFVVFYFIFFISSCLLFH